MCSEWWANEEIQGRQRWGEGRKDAHRLSSPTFFFFFFSVRGNRSQRKMQLYIRGALRKSTWEETGAGFDQTERNIWSFILQNRGTLKQTVNRDVHPVCCTDSWEHEWGEERRAGHPGQSHPASAEAPKTGHPVHTQGLGWPAAPGRTQETRNLQRPGESSIQQQRLWRGGEGFLLKFTPLLLIKCTFV